MLVKTSMTAKTLNQRFLKVRFRIISEKI